MSRYVALLRGINVGGRNKLPMKELSALFREAQCTDVVTFIQSGNVVFDAPASVVKKLPATIASAIEKRHELSVPVVIRSADEMSAVLERNPFRKAPPQMLHVYFLADAPAAAAVKLLDPNRSPGDEYVVEGREIFLRLPNGMGRTKLTNQYFDSRLDTVSTARNWKTVHELVALSR